MKLMIKGLFVLFAFFIFSQNLSSAKMFSIEIFFNGSDMRLNSLTLLDGDTISKYNGHQYNISLVDENNNTLYLESFDVPVVFYTADPRWFDETGKQIYIPTRNISLNWDVELNIPYFETAKYLRVTRSEIVLLEANILSYIKCNKNSVCDYNEDIFSCSEDCREGIEKKKLECIKDEICYSECFERDVDCVNGTATGSLAVSYNISQKISGGNIEGLNEDLKEGKTGINKWFKWIILGLVITIIITLILIIWLVKRDREI